MNISVKSWPSLFAAADLVISRAGANAICELQGALQTQYPDPAL